jgi:hypothetical protein
MQQLTINVCFILGTVALYRVNFVHLGRNVLPLQQIKPYNVWSNRKLILVLRVFALWSVFDQWFQLGNRSQTVYIHCIHTSLVLKGCCKDEHRCLQRKAYFPFTKTPAFPKQMLHLKCSMYRKEIKHLQLQNLEPRFPVLFSKSRTQFLNQDSAAYFQCSCNWVAIRLCFRVCH